jgi:hypothetical protein
MAFLLSFVRLFHEAAASQAAEDLRNHPFFRDETPLYYFLKLSPLPL